MCGEKAESQRTWSTMLASMARPSARGDKLLRIPLILFLLSREGEASLPGPQQLVGLAWGSEVGSVSLNPRSLRVSPIWCYAYGDNLALGTLPAVGRDRAGDGYLPLPHLLHVGAESQWLMDGYRA